MEGMFPANYAEDDPSDVACKATVGDRANFDGTSLCVTGNKVKCVKDGCRDSCVPGQISFSCFLGVVGICDAGCGKYVCGGCVSGGGGGGQPSKSDTILSTAFTLIPYHRSRAFKDGR
jgi:hypothetical protein